MAKMESKIIWAKKGVEDSALGRFLLEIGFTIKHEILEADREYVYFILSDFAPSEIKFPRVELLEEKMPRELAKKVRAKLSLNLVDQLEVRNLIKNYFNEGSEFDIVDRYSKDFKNIYTIKVQDFLNVGYFVDLIVVEAYKNGFDHSYIRQYLNLMLEYNFRTVEAKGSILPVEISFSYNGSGFVVQLLSTINSFHIQNDYHDFIPKMINEIKPNYLDVCYVATRSRLIISALWFKDSSLKDFQASFFTEVIKKPRNKINTQSEIIPKISNAENVSYVPNPKSGENEIGLITLARKIAQWIESQAIDGNVDGVEIPQLSIDQIELKVEDYQEIFPSTKKTEKLIVLIKNILSEKDQINEYVESKKSNIDEAVEKIVQVISGASFEEIESITKVKGQDEEDAFKTIVKGFKEEVDNDKTIVAGGKEKPTEKDAWKIKQGEIGKYLKEEVTRMKASGEQVTTEDIAMIISNASGADQAQSKKLISGILDQVMVNEYLEEKVIIPMKNEEENSQDDKLELKSLPSSVSQISNFDNVRFAKLEEQNVKMRKLLEQMKNELIKAKAMQVNNYQATTSNSESEELDADELAKLSKIADPNILKDEIKSLRSQLRLSLKSKSDTDQLLIQKDLKIAQSEKRLNDFKNSSQRQADLLDKEKLFNLENENKNLLSQLDLAKNKISTIASNTSQKESEILIKKDKELETVRQNFQFAQTVIEKLKDEKNQLEAKLKLEKELSKKHRQEVLQVTDQSLNEMNSKFQTQEMNTTIQKESKKDSGSEELKQKEKLITQLATEKKALDEKLKNQVLETKKLEHKTKILQSQLDEAQKKKGSQASAGNNRAQEALQRQLDMVNAKAVETTNDLTERKREILKLKQENTLMSQKIQELERKLSNSDKKAS